LVVTGGIDFDGSIEDLTVTGTSTLNGAVTAGSTLTVTGVLDPSGGIDTNGDNLTVDVGSGTLALTGANITLTTTDSVTFTVTDDVVMNITDDLDINVTGAITIDGASIILRPTSGTGRITLDETDHTILTHTNTDLLISGSSDNGTDDSAIVTIENTSSTSQADGLTIRLRQDPPGATNVFTRFVSNTEASNVTRGRIRGSGAATDSAFLTDDATDPVASATSGASTAVQVNDAGDVVYASGGADYGEWLEIGDPYEWGLTAEDIESKKDDFFFGIPEGYVVYVRDKKIYKEFPGTPMVVTYRAIVIGNERERGEGYFGQVVSFIGQVPVFVKGPVDSGDLLVPSGSYYCNAVPVDELNFKKYIRAIGTAWESSESDGFGKVLCAIGVKNIQ
jgi:hypothetical protein